jgi:hypothetical protein
MVYKKKILDVNDDYYTHCLFYNKSPKDHKPKTKSKVTTSKSSKAALVSEENTVPN